MGHSVYSLAVPFLVIFMVIFTKRVALSLFSGIVLGALLITDGRLGSLLSYIYSKISAVFYTSSPSGFQPNLSSLCVFGFLITLGVLSQVIASSGAINSFVHWAKNYVKSPRQSEGIALLAGLVIFIDDYFNALIVGQISKSLNDMHQSSRERLAYIIDSTSAPVCLLMPISSWGAYIVGVMQNEGSPLLKDSFALLLASIGSNYYAWFALVAVFLAIVWQINLPAMQKYQNVGVQDLQTLELDPNAHAPVFVLLASIASLIVSITALMFYTGYTHSQSKELLDILKHTNSAFSLFAGGLFSLALCALLARPYLPKNSFLSLSKKGFLSMAGAIWVLVLAWAIGPMIRDDLQTGVYLASLLQHFEGVFLLMPLLLFLISGFIAFTTGTSWGAFAIMLPIGAGMVSVVGGDIVLVLSAILSGAVYGDHASPISDTTILSATGAGCSVQSHFLTQLPYATLTAGCAMVAFLAASLTLSKTIGFLVGLGLLAGLFYFLKTLFK
ncbi:Sodium:Proton Antiporter NhaC [Helicobacter sp. NHP21005]|uniref:Na+/H+ antiporter NhaC family protein n=1 Tax=Helicobacter felistomachi TaxID=3040201 RepID=UPI00257277F5|nr:Na+/H+ antiporter NhaC family protein [Helicobacter sp. NHP21005]BEG57033.1 Sodium:Proton Antiporter NhaC [Helicobacter sp. NHP21005]